MQLWKREGIKYARKKEQKSAKNVNSTEKHSNTTENVALCGGGGGGMHNPLDSLTSCSTAWVAGRRGWLVRAQQSDKLWLCCGFHTKVDGNRKLPPGYVL